jgi:diguanylate cyclase (GGDEF)-like protein
MSGAARVVVWRLERAQGQIIPLGAAGAPRPNPQQLQGDPIAWAMDHKISMRIDPPPTWSGTPRVYAIPVASSDDELVLTVELTDTDPIEATKFDGLALYVGAIMNAESERHRLIEQHARADELIALLRRLPAATDAESLGYQLARAASDLINGEGAALSLWEQEKGTVVAVEGDAIAAGATFGANESETALAARAAAVLVRQPGSLGALPLVANAERFRRAPKAMIAVPLKAGHDVVAIISAWSSDSIGEHALRDLETLAPYAALQLKQARELGAMRTLAERDTLTGLNNRRAFDQHFASESARFERYERPFSVVIFDLDHFKAVNDRYGHQGGDFILQHVAKVITTTLRDVDFVARLGGEEFVAVLPETRIDKAVEIAERVRTKVEETAASWRGELITVRLSAGISSVPDVVKRPDLLLASADQALYQSKNAGRNQVTAATAS